MTVCTGFEGISLTGAVGSGCEIGRLGTNGTWEGGGGGSIHPLGTGLDVEGTWDGPGMT